MLLNRFSEHNIWMDTSRVDTEDVDESLVIIAPLLQ